MKVMFIVQGEGRGHLTQAITLERLLRQNGHEVTAVLVGKSRRRSLPRFFLDNIGAPVRQFASPNFRPGQANRRSRLAGSVLYNVARLPLYARSTAYVRRQIKESGADLVVNFYELVTGLAYLFLPPDVPQVSIGHQYLFLHHDFRFPHTSRAALWGLNFFTRLTSVGACRRLALSFRPMPDDSRHRLAVVPPLLREEVMRQQPVAGNYIHGYMVNDGFAADVEAWHSAHPDVALRFFWDRKGAPPVKRVDPTLAYYALDDRAFLQQMAGCRAYASTAGFESVCEAMLLGKPILMVPAHIEQECNAHDAALSGAGIVCRRFDLDRLTRFAADHRPDPSFAPWVRSAGPRIVDELERAAAAPLYGLAARAGLA